LEATIKAISKDGQMSDTVVRARIDSKTKERAAAALDAMGLSISDAIRLRICDDKLRLARTGTHTDLFKE
jgi:RelB antitoxin